MKMVMIMGTGGGGGGGGGTVKNFTISIEIYFLEISFKLFRDYSF